MSTERVTLKLDQIRIDGGTQPRAAIDQQVVAEYAELYRNGTELPPVTVFCDGANYWLADGFHRFCARQKNRSADISAHVHQGTRREAILFSVGANATHGLRRTNADKRRAVRVLLADSEWSNWSNREIGQRCGVHHSTVAAARNQLAAIAGQHPTKRTFIHAKTGKPTTMNTANIGRNQKRMPSAGVQTVKIAARALHPVRGHSNQQSAMVILNLPHNPERAARAILSALGRDYAWALTQEIAAILEGNQGPHATWADSQKETPDRRVTI